MTWPVCFYNGLGLSIGTKLVSINDRPSNFSMIVGPLLIGGEIFFLRRILHEPVGGTPRHVCRIFRAKNRRSDLRMFNSSILIIFSVLLLLLLLHS